MLLITFVFVLCSALPTPSQRDSSPADSCWHHSEVSWGQHGAAWCFLSAWKWMCMLLCMGSTPLPAMGAPLPAATRSEYSSLLTRVICLKTKISPDYRKEQHFSTLPLFGDTICSSFHILFSFIGCRVVKKGMRYIYHVHRKSTNITVPGCSVGRWGRWGSAGAPKWGAPQQPEKILFHSLPTRCLFLMSPKSFLFHLMIITGLKKTQPRSPESS